MTTVDDLPDELLIHTFSWIDETELYSSGTIFTCARWAVNVWPHCKTKLSYMSYDFIKWQMIESYPHIRQQCKVGGVPLKMPVLFKKLQAFPKLEKICLQSCKGLSDPWMEKIVKQYANVLRHLDISRNGKNKISSKCMLSIKNNCKNLKYLSISGCDQFYTGEGFFKSLPASLQELDVSNIGAFRWQNLYNLIQNRPGLIIHANHLTTISYFDDSNFEDLATLYSEPIAKLLFHEAFILERPEEVLVPMFEILNSQFPPMSLVSSCLIAGHHKILSCLRAILFPIDSIPIAVVNKCLDLGYDQVLAKLRVHHYSQFNTLSDESLTDMVRRGDDLCIIQLRLANLSKSVWERIPISAIRELVLSGKKALLQLAELQLPMLGKYEFISIEDIHTLIRKGHMTVLKIILNAGYGPVNDIDPQIVLEAIQNGNTSILAHLKNANRDKYEEIRKMEKHFMIISPTSPVSGSTPISDSIFTTTTSEETVDHPESVICKPDDDRSNKKKPKGSKPKKHQKKKK